MSKALASKLANDMGLLGFYKFVDARQRKDIDGEIENGAYDWFRAAGRAFDGDAERLAEGGVQDLLESMQPALDIEGVKLTDFEQSHSEQGYTLRVGTHNYTLWSEGERRRSWELTTDRTITLTNLWLATAGSEERIHVLGGAGGHDAIFVLLTPAMRECIAKSGVFGKGDIPVAL